MVFALLLFFAAVPTFDDAFRAGLVALQRSDLAAAQVNLEAAAKLAPSNGRVWVALSQTYWKLHQNAKADDAADKAAALAPGDAVVLETLAVYFTGSGQPLKAEALYFQTAEPLLKQEKFAEAIAVLEPAHTRLAGSAQIELALGVAYYGLRRFDDAADAFLRTIAVAPDLEQPYLFLGKFLDQIPARLPEVTKKFVAYEEANPSSYVGYLLHGKALNAQSIEPEETLRLLTKALAINDRDASAHFELAVVLDRLQRFGDAVGEFRRAVAIDPSDSATHYRLARDYDRLGKHDDADAERALHAKLVKAQGEMR